MWYSRVCSTSSVLDLFIFTFYSIGFLGSPANFHEAMGPVCEVVYGYAGCIYDKKHFC